MASARSRIVVSMAGDGGRHGHVVRLEPLVERGDRVAEVDLRGPQLQERIDERPQLPCLHQRFACQADESREALGRHANDAVGLLGRPRRGGSGGWCDGQRGWRRRGWQLRRGWRRCGWRRCGWRRCGWRLGSRRELFRDRSGRTSAEPTSAGSVSMAASSATSCSARADQGPSGARASSALAIAARKSMPASSRSACSGLHAEGALACRHEHVLDRVRDAHGRIEPDDASRPLERVRRPHHRLDRRRRLLELLDRQHAARQHGRLAFGLQPEQIRASRIRSGLQP